MPRAPLCPFYGRAEKEKLVCLIGGADTTGVGELQMNFPDRSCRLHYWVNYCCGEWKGCTLASLLWKEYEDREKHPPKRTPEKRRSCSRCNAVKRKR